MRLCPSPTIHWVAFSAIKQSQPISDNTLLLSPRTPQPWFQGLFADNFDCQPDGRPWTGSFRDRFTALRGNLSDLFVLHGHRRTLPNALRVRVGPRLNAYGIRRYSHNYSSHILSFMVRLGSGFSLPSGSYLTLAETQPRGRHTGVGKVELNVTGGGHLYLIYWDAQGRHGTSTRTLFWT